MLLLFMDVETTGLFSYDKPADAPGQPRIAEICGIMTDAAGEPVEQLNVLIRPDGWTMSPEITAINGLTTEMCAARGVPIREPLEWMAGRMIMATKILAFGVAFDLKCLRGEFRRAGLDDLYPLGEARKVCIQQMARKVTALPKNKTPKLIEAVDIILREKLEGAHGALEDTTAAMRIYFALIGNALAAARSAPALATVN